MSRVEMLSAVAGESLSVSDLGVRIGVPEPLAWSLPRTATLARLRAARRSPVTLVNAPAGWGKTTVLAIWARSREMTGPVVWLTIDPVSPPVSPSWLVDAVALTGLAMRVDPDAAVRAGKRAPTIVVDDVHRVQDPAALAGMKATIQAARGVRFVLAGRGEPVPAHDWRLSGVADEVGRAHLAMDVPETRALLAAHNVELTEAALHELHALTEGWPAGVQLAALAMKPSTERAWSVEEVGRHDGPVSQYVDAEVLAPLSPESRLLLVEASVVDYVNAALFEALTGRDDGANVLAAFERETGFVTRCPGDAGWYRYHQLVGRVLYSRLQHESATRVTALHGTAANWHLAFGLPTDALRHALAARDWDCAEEVFERHWPDLLAGPRRHPMRTGAPAPPTTVRDNPRLAMAVAAERLEAGDVEATRAYLQAVERAPDGDEVTGAFLVVTARAAGDLDAVVALGGGLAGGGLAGGGLAGGEGGSPAAGRPGTPADVPGAIALGIARLHAGDLANAEAPLRRALVTAQRIGLPQAQLTAASHLAAIDAASGRLHAAMRAARLAQSLGDRHGISSAGELTWARLALAETYYQWNRLDDARHLVNEALDDGHLDPSALAVATSVRARICAATGGAMANLLSPGLHQEVLDPALPACLRRALVLTEAELRLALGDPASARRLIADWHDEPTCVAWAAVLEGGALLADGNPDGATTVTAPYLDPANSPSLTLTVHAGLITAMAGRARNDRMQIMRGLDIALGIAEEEGHRRPFVAGGHPLRDLMERYGPGMPVYRPVLGELVRIDLGGEAGPAGGGATARQAGGRTGDLIEPLTERELTVLRYLQETLSNVEIASILYVSVNTVKTHVKNIYRKLQAGRRREAVQRARQLRLL